MHSFGLLNTLIVMLYFAAMLLVGVRYARRQESAEEYFLAGRSLPWWPVAMSMYASLTSATTYLVLPGKAYADNVALIVVSLVSPLVAPILIFGFYPVYRRLRVVTSYEFLGLRFGRPARWAASLLFLLGRMGWLSVVVYAPSLAMAVITGWDLTPCILLMGLLATAYTVLGGLSAVVWTDVAQFVILVSGAVWVAATLPGHVPGGLAGIWHTAAESGRLQVFDMHGSFATTTIWGVAVSFFLQMLQDYGTDQVTVQRLMAVRDDRGVAKAIVFNAASDFLMVGLLLFVGLGILAHARAQGAPPPANPEEVLPRYVLAALPAGVSGLVVTAILAAAMSSLDSGINSLATVIVHDLVRPLHTFRSAVREVALARGLTLALGVMATAAAFAVRSLGGILEAFIFFMSLFSAPVLALFVLGMATHRGRFAGWLAGVAVSVPATLWLKGAQAARVDWSWRFPIAFGLCLGVAWAVSRALPARAR